MIERNQAFIDQANYYGVPEHMIEGLELYVFHRTSPGSFMRAVLENDLKGAVGKADHINKHHLHEICSFIYNCIPAVSQGSPEKVREWLHKDEETRSS